MKPQHREILDFIEKELEESSSYRFGQVLHNLRINISADDKNTDKQNLRLVDIFHDSDNDILRRIKLGIEEDKKAREKISQI